MARTAFVCRTDGSYQQVTDYTSVQESLIENYQDGGNYRDLFSTPLDQDASASTMDGIFLPNDGDAYVALGGTATYARISDDIQHEPPRAESRKHTRLRFYASRSYTVANVNVANNWLELPAGQELSLHDRVSVRSTGAVPGGLASSIGYWVIAISGNLVLISNAYMGSEINITDVGSGVITLDAQVPIADFKPGEWTSWSNTRPFRF